MPRSHQHHIVRAFLYGLVLAIFLFKSHTLFFQAEAPVLKQVLSASAVLALESVPKPVAIIGEGASEPIGINGRAYFLGRINQEDVRIDALLEKNSDQALPIASITKLVSVLVASDYFKTGDTLTVPSSIEQQPWPSKRFSGNEKISFDSLTKASLIESNNDAVRTMAANFKGNFIGAMNTKAKELFLTSAYFSNETGVDPQTAGTSANRSSARDIARLMTVFYDKEKTLSSISTLQFEDITFPNGVPYYTAYNTNEFAYKPVEGYTLKASKTGTTDLAGRNLVVVMEDRYGVHYVGVVLGSPNAFDDMRRLFSRI